MARTKAEKDQLLEAYVRVMAKLVQRRREFEGVKMVEGVPDMFAKEARGLVQKDRLARTACPECGGPLGQFPYEMHGQTVCNNCGVSQMRRYTPKQPKL